MGTFRECREMVDLPQCSCSSEIDTIVWGPWSSDFNHGPFAIINERNLCEKIKEISVGGNRDSVHIIRDSLISNAPYRNIQLCKERLHQLTGPDHLKSDRIRSLLQDSSSRLENLCFLNYEPSETDPTKKHIQVCKCHNCAPEMGVIIRDMEEAIQALKCMDEVRRYIKAYIAFSKSYESRLGILYADFMKERRRRIRTIWQLYQTHQHLKSHNVTITLNQAAQGLRQDIQKGYGARYATARCSNHVRDKGVAAVKRLSEDIETSVALLQQFLQTMDRERFRWLLRQVFRPSVGEAPEMPSTGVVIGIPPVKPGSWEILQQAPLPWTWPSFPAVEWFECLTGIALYDCCLVTHDFSLLHPPTAVDLEVES